MKTYFTSESVTEGHPDKVCDRIADAILDETLRLDPLAHVACEVATTTNMIHVMGEITAQGAPAYADVIKRTVREIGYDESNVGFSASEATILLNIHEQSPDIARGVLQKEVKKQGAGDQGIVFGYACSETPSLMPLSFELATLLCQRLAYVRRMRAVPFLRPDGKAQVTLEYENGVPKRIDTVVLSAQHTDTVSLEELRFTLMDEVILPTLPEALVDENTRYLINPTGRFVLGGPAADTGVTGRKLICDTYGGHGRHGGGAFSGKDPSKVDRSAAYMARFLAKNIVSSGMADRCEIQIGYAIGVAEPVSLHVETFGTEHVSRETILDEIRCREDLSPYGIIQKFDLCRPIYEPLSCYGHFGRNADFMPWERIEWH